MSYDLRLAVKVEGGNNLYAIIATPEHDSPTYNIGKMLRKCTGWDFKQREWYNVADVLPLIQHGISELKSHESEYKQYNASNGWGTTETALMVLESLEECIMDNAKDGSGWSGNQIPLELMYVSW